MNRNSGKETTRAQYQAQLDHERSKRARDRMPLFEAYLELAVKVAPEE